VARAFLHETIHNVWASVSATHSMIMEQRVLLRMATTHNIRQAAETVDIAYNTAGSTAIYMDSPIRRCFSALTRRQLEQTE
jgi:hypothetical protein